MEWEVEETFFDRLDGINKMGVGVSERECVAPCWTPCPGSPDARHKAGHMPKRNIAVFLSGGATRARVAFFSPSCHCVLMVESREYSNAEPRRAPRIAEKNCGSACGFRALLSASIRAGLRHPRMPSIPVGSGFGMVRSVLADALEEAAEEGARFVGH